MPSTRLGAADGQYPHLTGLDLVQELAEARRAERDLAAEDCRQQVTATVVGDEVDLLRVDADGLGQLHRQQMVGAARGRSAADGELDFGSAFQAVTRSSMVLYGEFLGTTMAPDSSISLAIGVVWSAWPGTCWCTGRRRRRGPSS